MPMLAQSLAVKQLRKHGWQSGKGQDADGLDELVKAW